MNLKEMSSRWAKWQVDLEFGNRLLNIPTRIMSIGMQFAILVKVFKFEIRHPIIVGFVGGLFFVLISYLVGKTRLRDKVEGRAGSKSEAWKKAFRNQEEIIKLLRERDD